jgi:hypothetical protein
MSKKVIIALTLIVAPILMFGQSIFDKYEDDPEVASVIVNKKMFSMLANMGLDSEDAEAKEVLDFVNEITGLRVFTTGNQGVSTKMKADFKKHINSSNLEELMRVKDGGQTVKFYVKEGSDENHVKELVMLATGLKEMTKDSDIKINGRSASDFETVVLSLTGNIDLRQIGKFTEKMDVPGGEHLKKAGKKKGK